MTLIPSSKDHDVVDTYKRTVYGIALVRVGNRYDADDIFQEVFMTYFKRPRIFLHEGHRKGWFIKTTMICCQNYFKTRKAFDPIDERTAQIPSADASHQALFDALFSLEKKYRTVIYLYYFEGYSTKEIASLLGLKEGTVRMQMTRARGVLKDFLEEQSDD